MTPADFVEEVRTLLHERAKAGDLLPGPSLEDLLRQITVVFEEAATWPGEGTPADLQETIEGLQADLEEAKEERNTWQRKAKELQVKVDCYGDDPDTGRAEEVERLRNLMRDSAKTFSNLTSDLAAPRTRKERIIAAMRSQVAEMRAEVGESEDE